MPRRPRSSPSRSPLNLTYPKRYRSPPAEYRFQKGQSGNLNGRPQGSENWSTIFAEELARPVIASIDGERTTITVEDALIDDMVRRALAGSLPHMLLLLRYEHHADPARVTAIIVEAGDGI